MYKSRKSTNLKIIIIMKEEIWRPVVGYEGLYEVSNFSRVKALSRKRVVHRNGKVFTQSFPEKVLVPLLGSNGRYHYSLHKDGKQKCVSRATIVARAWVEGYKDGYEVNHIDENTQNDSIENLEWCSHLYNMRYGTRKKRAISKMIATKGKKVVAKDKNGEIIDEFPTIAEACRKYGCASSNISKCCSRKIKSLVGLKWEYV